MIGNVLHPSVPISNDEVHCMQSVSISLSLSLCASILKKIGKRDREGGGGEREEIEGEREGERIYMCMDEYCVECHCYSVFVPCIDDCMYKFNNDM